MCVQRPGPAPGPLPPRGDVLPARQQRLHGGGDPVVVGDLGGRIAVVAVRQRLEGGPRTDRVRRMEHPSELALALARGHFHGQDRAVVVDQGAQGQGALVGGERAGQLGVVQRQPPVEPGDRAHRFQGEVPDRQPGETEE